METAGAEMTTRGLEKPRKAGQCGSIPRRVQTDKFNKFNVLRTPRPGTKDFHRVFHRCGKLLPRGSASLESWRIYHRPDGLHNRLTKKAGNRLRDDGLGAGETGRGPLPHRRPAAAAGRRAPAALTQRVPGRYDSDFSRRSLRQGRESHEAHVSTQSPTSTAYPWIPRPDADEERPAGPQAPSGEGSQASDRILAFVRPG
jgi:hypothetical protein